MLDQDEGTWAITSGSRYRHDFRCLLPIRSCALSRLRLPRSVLAESQRITVRILEEAQKHSMADIDDRSHWDSLRNQAVTSSGNVNYDKRTDGATTSDSGGVEVAPDRGGRKVGKTKLSPRRRAVSLVEY